MKLKPTYLLLCLLLVCGLASAQIQEPFSVRFSQSINGDFTTIGNNMLSRTATGNYNANGDNHNFNNNVYVDIDNDPDTFNSSSANFTNPEVSTDCITVFKAYLYWAAADTELLFGGDHQPNWDFNQVRLMLPGQTNYSTVTADEVIFRGRNTHFSNDPYVCVADISNQVMALADKFGTYQVANVEASEGTLNHSDSGTSGGWQIVFVYESPDLPSKDITIFDGYAHVTATVNDFDINFSGFQTTPVGAVNAKVLLGNLEGDRSLSGDRLQIRNTANNFVNLTAPQRSANNFFNSRITVGNGDFVDRNPASTNTLGFDAAVFDLNNPNNSIIGNNQTNATLRLTSNQEVYGLYLLGLAVENYRPYLDPLVITQTSGSNPTAAGSTVGINFEIGNNGNDNAWQVNLATNIPEQATLVEPIAGLPNGISYTYNAGNGDLEFQVDNGLLDVNAPSINIPFELALADSCYFLEDNCDLSFDLQFTATYIGEDNPAQTITLSTADATSCEALPFVVNIDQPVVNWLTPAGALDVTVDCNDPAALAAAQTLEPEPDQCSFILNKTSGPAVINGCTETYTNTWNFTDACGVTIADYVQVITVTDTEDPTATGPADISLACTANIPAPDPSIITDAADNCSTPTVSFVSDVSDVQGCTETITRTYRVADDCGNSIDLVQLIVLTDNEAPTASNPAPIQVSCAGDIPAADPSVVTDATDDCGAPTVSFVSESSDNGSCPETITRIYRVSDACGNSIDVTQSIIILDDINPTASDPAPIQVSCISEVPAPDINVVTDATDNCGAPSISFISEVSDNQSCPETLTRTYRVTDACGNGIDVTQTIVIQDDILPTASNPSPIQVSCIAEVPAPDTAVVTDATDNCGAPVVSFVSESSDNQSCPETITRIYRVADACGNSIDVAQSIIVQDDILPTASNPAPIQVSCITEVPAADTAIVTDEADNCGTPTVSFVSESSDNQSCPETITRIYRVTDDCGNSIDVTHNIIVQDDIAPTASDPDPILVECVEDVPAPDPLVVQNPSDNCGVPVVSFVSDTSDNQSCPETISRIYNVEDACGNFVRVTQLIIIQDTTAPTATAPAPVTVSCVEEIPAVDTALITDATDNCSSPVVTFTSETTDGNSCPQTLTRIYTVTDNCGNSIDVAHVITIMDDIAPTASNPLPLSFECLEDVPAADTAVITDAQDNCGTPVVAFVSEALTGADCQQLLTRIYSVTDACGNSIEVTHEIQIQDETAPTADTPVSMIFECLDEVPEPDPSIVTNLWDNCGTPQVTFVSDQIQSTGCPTNINRIYRVSDACGNSTDVVQLIQVMDQTAPELITDFDRLISVTCGTAPDAPTLQFTDNCSQDLYIDFYEDLVYVSDSEYELVRTWTAIDECDNQTQATQTIRMLMNDEYDIVSLVFCDDDTAVDLYGLIENTTELSGSWSGDSVALLDNGAFDPSEAGSGLYNVIYTYEENDCSWTTEFRIAVNGGCAETDTPCDINRNDVTISKLVTGNNDGYNDFFEVNYDQSQRTSSSACTFRVEVQFFNRWGMKVFEDMDYSNKWDGRAPSSSVGSSETLPTGTYYYIVNLVDSGLKPIQGFILLGSE